MTTIYSQKSIFLKLILCLCVALPRPVLSRSSASTSYPFNTPNTCIQSSPPCLAAKCKDGIALLAIHVHDYESNVLHSNELLLDNIGPIRVEQLDHNAVLLNSGWRVDGHILAEKGKELCEQDSTLYGIQKDRDYGQRLGWGLVNHLVECHVKESTRSLSTAALLATNAHGSELYLVDTTGLYKCRAMAIGSHAKEINACLANFDFCDMNVEDGVHKLLQILRDCREGKRNEKDGSDHESWRMPHESVVEILMLKTEGKRIQRKREILLPPSLDNDVEV